jgi:hypothetical protein
MAKRAKVKETKICKTCGLPFENRKKWAQRGQWDEIKYCSERCRRSSQNGQKDES